MGQAEGRQADEVASNVNAHMRDMPPSQFLSVGLALQLIFPRDGKELHCGSTLLGWKEGVFLIGELPFPTGQPLDVGPDTPCIVRYLYAGKVVGYRSQTRAGQLSPEPLLFLSFPSRLEQILLRKHPRIEMSERVSLTPCDARGHSMRHEPAIGTFLDLSVAGCRVWISDSETAFTPGITVSLDFELPGIGHIANLTGTIRSVSEQSGNLILGIEFQFYHREYIEFRGWGGTVRKAIEQFVAQRHTQPVP